MFATGSGFKIKLRFIILALVLSGSFVGEGVWSPLTVNNFLRINACFLLFSIGEFLFSFSPSSSSKSVTNDVFLTIVSNFDYFPFFYCAFLIKSIFFTGFIYAVNMLRRVIGSMSSSAFSLSDLPSLSSSSLHLACSI